MLSKRFISAAIILAGATLLSGGTAFGTEALSLTENSSTSLTADLSGNFTALTVSVQNTSADHWTLTFSETGTTPTLTGSATWTEPDPGSTAGNVVEQGANSDQLIVISDDPNETGLADGSDTLAIHVDGSVLHVEFNDDDDGSSVPDATATLPLLSLSLAGLGFLARRLKA